MAAGPASVVVALTAWLWPIGIGGSMPVGGDVTQFQIGLMSVLGEAIRDARLPLWNDRWGFGFPGLAESQMGVYYPPHAALYGPMPVELAYTISMVLHVVWGGLGARWAARRFGASEPGAVLAGLAWAASGFFLIHLPHQWAYTVGSWTPWAWGLGWGILSGWSGRRAPWMLAAVLTVQILPGHFQLAFCTQVSLLAMTAGAVLTAAKGERRRVAARAAAVLLPIAAAFPMAACQVVPTLQLARLAETQRDFEYLSGFAATPLHLVNLVAPELFHRSPLWRPVAWDPFHTSPEEHLLYVGLVPLFLALGAIARPGNHAGAVRVLIVVLAAGLVLSLGPYVPGFRQVSEWPGFSFFRAPARWGMIATLALAILAGLGLDAVRDGRWRRPGRSLVLFAIGAAAWIGGVVGLFEIGLRSTDGPGRSGLPAVYQRGFSLMPWDDGRTAADVLFEARRPQNDLRVLAGQARENLGDVPAGGLRLDRERGRIYRAELGTTAALLVAAIVLAPLATRRRAFAVGLVVLMVVDLGLLARRRPVDSAPIRPLTGQSVLLGRLAALPEGTRSIDPFRNLPMVAGVSPILSYRTLDLPILGGLVALADRLPADDREAGAILDAQRAVGARVRVVGPLGAGAEALVDRFVGTGRLDSAEFLDDPTMTGWLIGPSYAESPIGSAGRYVLLDAGPAPRSWLVPAIDPETLARLRALPGEPGPVLSTLAASRPLDAVASAPEHLELAVEADGPAVVVVAQLDYPEWRAFWIDPDGRANPATIARVLGGWQGIPVPGPGRWTLRLDYRGRAEASGLVISGLAWAGWGIGLRLVTRSRTPGTPVQAEPSTG